MEEKARVRYSALSQDEIWAEPAGRGGAYVEDLRYRYQPVEKVPWKSIMLALFLLLFGSLFLVLFYLMLANHMGGDSSQAFGFLVLGILLFLPGFYETRIAYYSWRGFKGYSYSRIPAY